MVLTPPVIAEVAEVTAEIVEVAETPAIRSSKIRTKGKRGQRGKAMASKAREIDEAPKSLEGTVSDVSVEKRPETGAWRYTLVFLALFALVGVVVVTLLVMYR